jgi:hypothetical protein
MIIDQHERPENGSDPILQELDWILENAELVRLARQDLARHYKRSKLGWRPVPIEVTKLFPESSAIRQNS